MKLKSQSGQSLVEYLILVCLISISSIAVVSVVGQNIKARYANISNSLRGKKNKVQLESSDKDQYKIRGLDDFNDSSYGK